MTQNKQKSKRQTATKAKSKAKTFGQKVLQALGVTYRSVMALLTLVLVALYVGSAYSDHLSPNVWVWFSYLSIAFPVFFFVSIVWTVVLAVLRRWKLVVLMLVAFCLTFEPVTRYWPLHAGGQDPLTEIVPDEGEPRAIRVDTLSILTYNTCWMGQTHLSKIEEHIPVMDVVRRSGADIVCLQEYAFTLTPGGHTETQLRNSVRDIYPYYDYLRYYYRKAMGIAVFSKYPIRKVERIDRDSKSWLASMYYEIDVNGQLVALVNNHLQTNAINPRDRELYDDMLEHFERDSIQRIRFGLVRKLGRGFLSRARQSNQIMRYLQARSAQSKALPLLVVGDFNDTPFSYCYQTIRDTLSDTWQDAGFGPGITYNRHHFWFRIDHILHSRQLRALRTRVLSQYKYSDHYPVAATFQLLPPDAMEN